MKKKREAKGISVSPARLLVNKSRDRKRDSYEIRSEKRVAIGNTRALGETIREERKARSMLDRLKYYRASCLAVRT